MLQKRDPVEEKKTENKSKKPKKKKKKVIYLEDDGHTIYSMENVVNSGRPKKGDKTELTRAERRAAIKAALAHYLPILLMVIGCFAIAMLLLYFWLR